MGGCEYIVEKFFRNVRMEPINEATSPSRTIGNKITLIQNI